MASVPVYVPMDGVHGEFIPLTHEYVTLTTTKFAAFEVGLLKNVVVIFGLMIHWGWLNGPVT